MQFSITEPIRVTLSSVNIRSELHGADHVPAVDLKVSFVAANTMLDELYLGPLRQMFYEAATAENEQQPELDGVAPATDTPVLRCLELEPIKLKHEWVGYTATLERGARGPDSDIIIGACAVGQMVVDMLQGGSCKFTFRIQAAGLTDTQLGPLATMIGLETGLTLVAPAEASVA